MGTSGEQATPSVDPGEAALVEAEARFERFRRRSGFWAGPAAAIAVAVSGPDTSARRLAAIMAFTGILWITESIPVAATALLAAALVVLAGVATAKEAFAAFGTPLLFLFVGSFFIAEAMNVHGLGERFARALARRARGRLSLLVALSGGAFLLSLWMSNTAATAVTLPIALSVARATGDRRYGAALVLSIAWGASVGGIGTPVGTPPNLIGIAALRDRAGVDVGFFRWMAVGLPTGALMLVFMWVLLAVRFRVRGGDLVKDDRVPPPWSRGEVATATAFGVAVTLWILPGILALTGPEWLEKAVQKRLSEEVTAILAATILFVWPVGEKDGEPRRALTWEEAARIDWGTVILFGGGVLLGDLAGKTGLAARWGEAAVGFTGASSVAGVTALVTGASIVLSEATSNTATATLLVPLAISIAQAAHVSPVAPALGATLGASFGFMLPISTAPNAMAYGTGQVSIREMASTGLVFDLVGYVAILSGLALFGPLAGLV